MSDIANEVEDREAHMLAIATLFKAAPLLDIEPDILRNITPHYQQRISECRRKLKMTIQNVPRYRTDADGTKHKQDGAYRYLTHEPIGRDSGTQVPAEWPTEHPAPFEPPFTLKG